MIPIGLLLGTVLLIFLCLALFSGFVLGAVHVFFAVVLWKHGSDLEGRLEQIRRRKTSFRNQHSRRAGFEYELRVSYGLDRRLEVDAPRIVKVFTSKNWNAFHDIEAGRIIPIRVWTRVPGWAALSVDIPGWNDWLVLMAIGGVLSLVYGWFLKKAFLALLRFLVLEGINEETSILYILGACFFLVPAYVYVTLIELIQTEDTDALPRESEIQSTDQRGQRSVIPRFANAIQVSFLSFVSRLEAETRVNRSAEMRAMLPERRTSHTLV